MRANRAVGIAARHAGLEGDTRQLVTVHGVAGDVVVAELHADRDGLERPARPQQLADPLELVALQQPELHQACQRCLEVAGLLAHEFELIGRCIVGDDPASAVTQQPAIGWKRFYPCPVFLRELREMLVAQHLQPPGAATEQQQQHGSGKAGDQHAAQEDPLLERIVLDPDPAHRPAQPRVVVRANTRAASGQQEAPTGTVSQRIQSVTG
jgi:hypothetical protein